MKKRKEGKWVKRYSGKGKEKDLRERKSHA